MRRTRSLENRFWEKIKVMGPEECWPWQGAKSNNYGDIRVFLDGRWKTVKATHVMWFLTHGTWPDAWMLHSCDNPPCVNPNHISEGTPKDNKQQELARRRNFEHRVTHCPQGHEYSAENTYTYPSKHNGICRMCRTCRKQRRNSNDNTDAPVTPHGRKLEAKR